jgi:hypothetical protein
MVANELKNNLINYIDLFRNDKTMFTVEESNVLLEVKLKLTTDKRLEQNEVFMLKKILPTLN